MSDFLIEPWDEDEDEPDCCHHGIGFDEECDDCAFEDEMDELDDLEATA